jgi:hypothetical protein
MLTVTEEQDFGSRVIRHLPQDVTPKENGFAVISAGYDTGFCVLFSGLIPLIMETRQLIPADVLKEKTEITPSHVEINATR